MSDPLVSRYASPEMAAIFSDDNKYRTWRRLWLALAEAQGELGLSVTRAQVEELRAHVDDLDLEAAAREEERLRHDVMAHLKVYARQCPLAGPILHLGATSAYVGDNTDILQMKAGLELLDRRLAAALRALAGFARHNRSLATLGYTHLQAAQLTTVGKRACLWAQDLLLDAQALAFERARLKLRGVKGTTGTQASFLELFHGDHAKVEELERRVALKLGSAGAYAVTGQTYPRKVDAAIMAVLGGIATSAAKFATDLRLLMGFGELEEPIGKDQVGSSAMAYKRNPVKTERIVALSRPVIAAYAVAATNASNQWLERTLDDSANRRSLLPQAFLATDAILLLVRTVASGLVVHERTIARAVARELPFMATEAVLMAAVARGGDRQELHERLRTMSFEVRRLQHEEGADNDLLARLAADPAFKMGLDELRALIDPMRFVGRAPEQVDAFLAAEIEPYLAAHPAAEDGAVRIKV